MLEDIKLYGRRRTLSGIVILIFLVFLARLYQLQLIYQEEYGKKSEENSIRTIPKEPVRGYMIDRLGRLEHPTLAICGRRDLLTPTKFSRELAEAMPNARDLALAYSGHAVMAERPERFNQVVLHFLDEERGAS